jgi:hypothetical protein
MVVVGELELEAGPRHGGACSRSGVRDDRFEIRHVPLARDDREPLPFEEIVALVRLLDLLVDVGDGGSARHATFAGSRYPAARS